MKKLVVLTGAGISAESGLKTFRDSDGLWEGYNIEDVATPGAWRKDPKLVLEFYNYRRRNVREAAPNAAHLELAALEKDAAGYEKLEEFLKKMQSLMVAIQATVSKTYFKHAQAQKQLFTLDNI